MRLISQMLMGLDKRSPETASAIEPLLSTVMPTSHHRRVSGLLRLGLLVLLLAGIGVACWTWSSGWPSAATLAERASAMSAAMVPEAAAAVGREPQLMTAHLPASVLPDPGRMIEPRKAAVEKETAVLENLYFVQVGNQLRVAAVFSQTPGYRLIRRAQGTQIALELPPGTRVGSLPGGGTPPMLQNVAWETHSDQTQLVFSFDQAYRCDELILKDHAKGEGWNLIMVVRPEAPDLRPRPSAEALSPPKPSIDSPESLEDAEPKPAPEAHPVFKEFVRQAVQPTDHQRAGTLFHKGITAFRKGRFAMAEQALRAALTIEPGHLRAREALLHLLDRQGHRSQIKTLLAEGLQRVPGHWPHRLRLARLLLEEGSLSRAAIILTSEPLPPTAETPDLHAMLAMVFLRQGRYGKAAETYRALLAAKPEQAVWWMGLGLALEGDRSLDAACKAYGQALVHEGLSEGLQKFIRQRLAAARQTETMQSSASQRLGKRRS